jgi:hypothetical protein
LLPLVLAACASDEPLSSPCPQVVAVSDAARLTKFGPGGRDLTDIRFEVELEDLQFTCEYEDGTIEGDLTVRIVASRGPADANRLAQFNYFVAVATLDRRVIAREEFDVAIPFPGNTTRGGVIEELTPRIPLEPGESGSDYTIYVGLELTSEELEFNRQSRR